MHVVSVILIVTCVANVEIGAAKSNKDSIPPSEDTKNVVTTTERNEEYLKDHTFVALIDIVFTDGSKRTCTGSIIHDNVVITAAHCFIKEFNQEVKPELTVSFVVIGTKKMFDTGYEQYLPIERVVTHPKFRGWTADLCLVYTFAGMTSDKPGTIIPLAGEKTSTYVDSNVTVLSWGHIKDVDSHNTRLPSKSEKCDSISLEDEDYKYNKDDDVKNYSNEGKVTAMLQANLRHRSIIGYTTRAPVPLFYKNKFRKERELSTERKIREKMREKPGRGPEPKSRSENTKLISRYLSGEERVNDKTHVHLHSKGRTETPNDDSLMSYDDRTASVYVGNSSYIKTETDQDLLQNRAAHFDSENNSQSHYENWRRQMGTQQNQLTVEIFGFVNVQTCKKMVQKAMISPYDIADGNDVVCYATGNRYFIKDEDSGAPAVRRGQLVAVTVGGADLDGDHVAIGMKMSCYCDWIADNLPNGDSHDLHCCKNCCDVRHKQEFRGRSLKHINKYLF